MALRIKAVHSCGMSYLHITGTDDAGRKVRVMARSQAGAEAVVEHCQAGAWTVASVHGLQCAEADAIANAAMN